MYVAEWTEEGGWKGEMRPYGPLALEPSAQVSCPTFTALACDVQPCAHTHIFCFVSTDVFASSPQEGCAANKCM